MRWRRMSWRQGIVSLAIGVAVCPAVAADLRPSWECLPANTAFMVRAPGLAEFWKTIQTRTKFGSVVLGPNRIDGVWQALASIQDGEGGESLDELEETFKKYGLELNDLFRVFDAECGAGVVAHQEQGMLLAWIEPGEEVARKFLAAIQQRAEEAEGTDEGQGAKRIDIELAGHPVTTLIHPVMRLDFDGVKVNAEDGEDFDEAMKRVTEGLKERAKNRQFKQVGERHTLVAVLGGRLLVGDTRFNSDPVDGAEVTGRETEALRRIFGSFLEAHAGGGEPALAAAIREPALAAAAIPGVPLIEMVGWPSVFLARASEENEELRSTLEQVGLDDLGGIMMRHAFDDGRWRTTVAMTLPAPRHGLFQVLDQPCDASEVPPFVTREVAEFSQVSFDLGAAYKTIRQVLVEQNEGGEQIANMFNVGDMQSQAWLGVDVATVLTGLGSRHWFLSFPPQVAAAMAQARAADDNGEEPTSVADRVAGVWQIVDDEPYVKLVGRLAQLAGGQLEEEQGFQGVRIPGGAAFYVGRGHLVMAIGEGTLEKTLAAIRTPPQGETSFRESDVPRRAADLLPARPARVYGVSDSTRTGGTLGMLRELAEVMEPDDIDDERMKKVFVAMKDLLPSARDMEGMFGIGALLVRMTDDGLLLESAWEMPAP